MVKVFTINDRYFLGDVEDAKSRWIQDGAYGSFSNWVLLNGYKELVFKNTSTERRSGQTTRLIDAAIQKLFTTGEAEVFDHYSGGWESRVLIAKKMLKRLQLEHGNRFKFDHQTLKFTL